MLEALDAAPSTIFTVIIIPDSGPGSTPPDANFQIGIKKLLSYNNTKGVPGIGITLDGIFFDESPADKTMTTYVATANVYAKAQGLKTVMQNTGTIPDDAYFSRQVGTDITPIFEEDYGDYSTAKQNLQAVADKYGRDKMCLVVYDSPTDETDIRNAVVDMAKNAGHIFMSDLSQSDAYLTFSKPRFEGFVRVMVEAFSS
ncbi:hypothetical protein ABW19_dt0202460 [Dactylella cylindrospora]|nr:hypothetical protein ABW19_dt0202460 [Dactylella cylindrospora]